MTRSVERAIRGDTSDLKSRIARSSFALNQKHLGALHPGYSLL
jgi:hypothetical protein